MGCWRWGVAALALVSAVLALEPAVLWRVPVGAMRVRGGLAHEVALGMPEGIGWGARAIAVLEDGRALGPGRAELADIEKLGGGRFTQRGLSFVVSSSDGTAPEVNGRPYRVQVPLACVPGVVDLVVLGWLAVGWWALSGCGERARLVGVVAALAGLRCWRFGLVPVVSHPDTALYEVLAAGDPFTRGFWTATRGGGYPLFLMLCGGDERVVAWAQLALSTVCWVLLGLAVGRRAAGGPVLAMAVVLGIASVPEVAQWDHVLLTESVSLSLTALLVALGLWALEVRSGWRGVPPLLGMVACGAALVAVRDANAVLVAGGAAACAGGFLWGRLPVRWLCVAAALAGIVAANGASVDRGERWLSPFMNVMRMRLARDPEWATPAGAGEAWARAEGRRAYAKHLVAHPGRVLEAMRVERDALVEPRLDGYAAPEYVSPLPRPLDSVLYARTPAVLVALLVMALWAMRPVCSARMVGIVLIAVAPAMAACAIIFDAIETGRHALPASVMMRLGAWIIVLMREPGFARVRRIS